jgi:VanZ family protein
MEEALLGQAWWRASGWRWLAWLAWLLISTVLLVGPSVARIFRQGIDTGANVPLDTTIYLLSKAFHVSAYALLAALTGLLLAPRRTRFLLLLLLSVHAFGTEYLQRFAPGRTGTLQDVGLDHLGLLLGLALTWKCWIRSRAPAPVPGPGTAQA